MFDNIGEKIKGLATFLFGIECIACIIAGFVMMGVDDDWEYFAIGLAIAFGGSLIAWASSFFMYGFGELICRVCSIEEKLNPQKVSKPIEKEQEEEKTTWESVKKDLAEEKKRELLPTSQQKSTCAVCGRENEHLKFCNLKTIWGTVAAGYVCEDCLVCGAAEIIEE